MKKLIITFLILTIYSLAFNQVVTTSRLWTGNVIDTLNKPVASFSLIITGYNISTVTTQDGQFSLDVSTISDTAKLTITTNNNNFEIATATSGTTNLTVNNDGAIVTKLPANLNSNPLKIKVKKKQIRCRLTDPGITGNTTWCDPNLIAWFSECSQGTDVQCPFTGIITNLPTGSYTVNLKINLTNGQSWDQGTYNITEAGTWEGSVYLRSTGNGFERNFKKTIQLNVLDGNNTIVKTFKYIISSCQ